MSKDDLISEDNIRMVRSASVVSFATLISRVLGYVRDMAMASIFGAGLASDAFIAAFRIPNLLRRLLGEGSLSIAFVPVFTDCLRHHGKLEAERLAVSSIRLLVLVLTLVSLAGIVLAPAIVHIFAWGFTHDPDKYALCVHLTRIMMPYVLFIGLMALCMGILNVLGHFAAPAFAPTVLNVAMIGLLFMMVWLSPSQNTRVMGLALGVILGGILQLSVQVPFLIKKGIRFWRFGPVWHPAMRQIFQLMGPAVFGAAVYQINNLVICLLGSLLSQGSITYLYYADRLVQFPLGLFAIAMATAILPTLSRQASEENWDALRDTFRHGLKLIFFITLPSSAGLIILRKPIVAVLFAHGNFMEQATELTAGALLYYAIGLWAFSSVRILIYVFYALKDTRTPVVVAAIAVAANLFLGGLLMRSMQHNGLALALSLASILHLVLLAVMLQQKMGRMGWRMIAGSFMRSGACAAFMSLCTVWAAHWFIPAGHRGRFEVLVGLIISIIISMTAYFGLAALMKAPELKTLKFIMFKRISSE